ncbi:FxSxx-COOH system tetratricopeptide repeat protein [Streptomyces sp. NPDC048211]|uniref:FxSxx-COOH system tetratricopeptide repeat protein n=1 Tax=Streptomyces sp. NPDC048211 TaxID=3365516 RepID=UPI00371198AF
MPGADPDSTGIEASGERSMAARSIGLAVSGDVRFVNLPPQAVQWAREVEAPPNTANLPGSASGVFVGRENALDLLRGMLTNSGDAAVTQTGAVHGLGGIGKSTLALHYAVRYRDTYTLVWWINAESPELIESGLASLATRLCPHWAHDATAEERTAWAVAWLQWHPGWLLVFDNVEHPDRLRPYLGSLSGGHHVATSRKATGWHTIGPTLPLDLLDPVASADLLCEIAYDRRTPTPEQRVEAEALAAELGYLPLALEQAGAYLHQTGKEIAAYRRALPRMLSKHSEGTDPERTVARVWNQSLQAIRERDPLAVTLLNAAAWLAPDSVPRAFLTPLVPDTDEADDAVDEALGVLHAYNMITLSSRTPTFSVHRLLQVVLRTPVTGTDHPAAGRTSAEQALLASLPPSGDPMPATMRQWEELMPHIIALAINLPPASANDTTIKLFDRASIHAGQAGQRVRAVPLFEAVLAQCEQVLGDTHPDTLKNRNNLANAYQDVRDLGRAVPLHEVTLAQSEQVLGDTHPDTLMRRNNLAGAYLAAGDLRRAVRLYEVTVGQCERVLGDTHPGTLKNRNNLADAYRAAGDLRRAVRLYEVTVGQCERVLGDTHPDTLTSWNNLAGAYRAAGDLGRAVPLLEVTVAQCERVLGDTHPDTLRTRNNLAGAYWEAGDLGRAVPLLEVTVAQYERVLGDTHPDTLTSRNNLAYAYWEVADLGRAVSLYEVTLAQCERVLGNAHPDTRRSRNNLARVKADIEEAAASPDPSKGSYAAMNSDEPDAQPAAGATPIGHETPVPPIPQ